MRPSNLTHDRASQSSRARLPRRSRSPQAGKLKTRCGESTEEAVARYQKAKADSEEIGAQRAAIQLGRERSVLIRVAVVDELAQRTHQTYARELARLVADAVAGLPPEVAELVRVEMAKSLAGLLSRVRP